VAADLSDALSHGDIPTGRVDVRAAQGEDLADAQPGVGQEAYEELVVLSAHGTGEPLDLGEGLRTG